VLDVGFALPCACIHVSDSGVPERLSNLDILMSITQEVKFLIRRCGYILRGDQHSEAGGSAQRAVCICIYGAQRAKQNIYTVL
jgi:hypothetical protein